MATTLYLVSAETPQGEGYWKVGITAKADPLKRNPAAYREVFRAQVFEDAAAAKQVELAIARTFAVFDRGLYGQGSVRGREAMAYPIGLDVASKIFDLCLAAWFEWQSQDSAGPFLAKEKLSGAYEGWMPFGQSGTAVSKKQAVERRIAWLAVHDTFKRDIGWASGSYDIAAITAAADAAWLAYFSMIEQCQQLLVQAEPAPPLAPMW